jgi:protein O-GlcNAc transferase
VTNPQVFELALQHHRAGRLAEAETLYQQILAVDPHHADALHALGLIANRMGRNEMAVDLISQAIQFKPGFAEAYCNLGIALSAGGRLDEAVTAYREAMRLLPGAAEIHNNLGNALNAQGRFEEAVAAYRQALQLRPTYVNAHYNLGVALSAQRRWDEAIASYQWALRLQPAYPGAHYNLGIALDARERWEEAIAAYRRAIQLKPDHVEAYNNLGCTLCAQGRPTETIAAYRQALELNPHRAKTHANLGLALPYAGRCDEAIASHRRSLALDPEDSTVHSHLLHTLLLDPAQDSDSIRAELRRWNDRFAEPLRGDQRPHAHDKNSERRLRIGYVSPNFRYHVVGENVFPVLERHDRSLFEVFCYSDVTRADALTGRFRETCDVWRDISALSDEETAELIRADGIDILIDLTLHTANRRLLIFARKPAPVQVTWAGYPGSTGLDAIDYRLTDPRLDPPGASDDSGSEEPVRLPHSFWCYRPVAESPPVNPLPALATGQVTFGSLNNYGKVNQGVLELWAQVLGAVKDSRLLLLSHEGEHRQRAQEVFASHGVDSGRIAWFTPASRQRYLEAYHRIDIGLDPFPYNGHTTSLDSFWMGVPVVTLVGRTIVGRAGLSQATNLGLPDLIAETPEQYREIAVRLANDLPALAELRAALRPRMAASPLADARQFTRDLEAAYRTMWRRWCEAGS